MQQNVHAMGNIVILMLHPIATRAIENLRLHAREQVPLVFMDFWTKERMPSQVDEVERTSMGVKRLIGCYPLEKWRFVAIGISTTIVKVLKSSFVGN